MKDQTQKNHEELLEATENGLIAHSATKDAVKELEMPLEAITIAATKGNKLLKEIVDNTKREKSSEPLEIKLQGVSLLTVKGDRGEKGEDGKPGKKGDKGDTVKGEKGDTGEKGKDGLDGRNGLNGENGLNGVQGERGENGPEGKKGENGSPDSAIEIKNKLESLSEDERLDYEFLKNSPDIMKMIRSQLPSSRDYNISELKDVNTKGIVEGQVLQWNGSSFVPVTISASSGSGFTYVNEIPTGTPSGDGQGAGLTTFNLLHTPTNPNGLMLYGSGGATSTWLYIQGVDYTLSVTTITFNAPPLQGIILRAFYS